MLVLALTVKVYEVPLVRSIISTVLVEPPTFIVELSGFVVISYSSISKPPVSDGGTQVTAILPLPATKLDICGAPDVVAGMTDPD